MHACKKITKFSATKKKSETFSSNEALSIRVRGMKHRDIEVENVRFIQVPSRCPERQNYDNAMYKGRNVTVKRLCEKQKPGKGRVKKISLPLSWPVVVPDPVFETAV